MFENLFNTPAHTLWRDVQDPEDSEGGGGRLRLGRGLVQRRTRRSDRLRRSRSGGDGNREALLSRWKQRGSQSDEICDILHRPESV